MENVRRVADLMLHRRAETVPVRVRWPRAGADEHPLPAIVFLPDAAPDRGVDEADDVLCHELCARVGGLVLCVPWLSHREGAPPSALARAEMALDWCADHAHELGADPERLVVAGRGAGAVAAAVLAARARSEGWPPLIRQVLIVDAHGSHGPAQSVPDSAARRALRPAAPDAAPLAPALVVSPAGPASRTRVARCAERLRAMGAVVEELYGTAEAPTGLAEPLLERLAATLRQACTGHATSEALR